MTKNISVSSFKDRRSIRIEPPKRFASLDLYELWEYRDLIWFLTIRSIKSSYRQMALGTFWVFLGPIGGVIINTFIFSNLAKLPSDGIPYPLFNYAALLPWTFFRGSLRSSSNSLSQYMGMISKVYFPRLTVTIVAVLSNLFDMLISFIVLAIFMIYYSYGLTWNILFLPLFILFAAMTSLSIGLWTAAIVVVYRDVKKILDFILTFWMYATPIVYSSSVISNEYIFIYKMNPLYWVVEGFRWSILGIGSPPDILMLIPILVVSVMFVIGLYIFRRAELNIVDWL